MPLILLSFLEVRGNPSLSATSQNVVSGRSQNRAAAGERHGARAT
jgi:hypothetical protein